MSPLKVEVTGCSAWIKLGDAAFYFSTFARAGETVRTLKMVHASLAAYEGGVTASTYADVEAFFVRALKATNFSGLDAMFKDEEVSA